MKALGGHVVENTGKACAAVWLTWRKSLLLSMRVQAIVQPDACIRLVHWAAPLLLLAGVLVLAIVHA